MEQQDAARVAEQFFPRRREIDLYGGAKEQVGPEPVLQPADLHAHRGLGAVQLCSGAREGA
jgi:hypothetical protein